jgi:hypothetical protein
MGKIAHPKDAVLEILKRLQASIADVRNTQVEMRCDIRDLITNNVRILSMIADTVKAKANGTRGSAA